MTMIDTKKPDKKLIGSEFKGYTHVGWVPCISGHLDFGLIEVGLEGDASKSRSKDKNKVDINFSTVGSYEDNPRRILLSSLVDWRDKRIGDGKYQVILLAQSNGSADSDEHYLTGTICILPKAYEEKHPDAYKFFFNDILSASRYWEKIKNKNWNSLNPNLWAQAQQELNLFWGSINSKISSYSVPTGTAKEIFFIKFFVDHTGITYLNYVPSEIDISDSITKLSAFTIVRQAFYYIKYSIHQHKHHTQESDALTTIIERDTLDPILDGKRLIGQLKRELVRTKRAQTKSYKKNEDNNPLGIIGYMHSLIRSCVVKGLLDDENRIREQEWLAGVKDSFIAQHNSIDFRRVYKEQVGQWARQWTALFLAGFAFIIIMWAGYNKPSDDNFKPKEDNAELLSQLFNYSLVDFLWYVGIWLLLITTAVHVLKYTYHLIYGPGIAKTVGKKSTFSLAAIVSISGFSVFIIFDVLSWYIFDTPFYIMQIPSYIMQMYHTVIDLFVSLGMLTAIGK